jgi:hypothetical protein
MSFVVWRGFGKHLAVILSTWTSFLNVQDAKGWGMRVSTIMYLSEMLSDYHSIGICENVPINKYTVLVSIGVVEN